MLNGGVARLVTDANERNKQAQPYQSLWLSHWKRTCSAPNAFGSEELDSRSANTTCKLGGDQMPDSLSKIGQDFPEGDSGAGDHSSGIQLASLDPCIVVPSRRCSSVGPDASDNPPKWMGTCSAIEDSVFGLNPLQESLVESSTHILPHKSDKGKAAGASGANKRCYERWQTDLHCERKERFRSLFHSDNSLDGCFRESVPCHHCLAMNNRGWFLKTQMRSGIRLFPNESNSSEEYETKKSHNDCYSQLKLQNCVHGVGTVRICNALDVSEGTLEGFPRFWQSNTDLSISKKTDVKVFKENDTFRSKRVITAINRNMAEVTECIGDMKASKVTIMNELSDDADIMELDSFNKNISKKNLHSASNFPVSTKAFNMESNEGVSSRKVGPGRLNYKLPDINLELPDLPAAAGLPQNTCPSSSKTLSVESDKLVEHVKQQPKLKYNAGLDELMNADASNRWVKRLKLSSSNSSIQGTKGSNFDASSSYERTSKHFNGIPNSNITESKSNPRKHHDGGSLVGDLSKKDADHLTENPKDKDMAFLLSHSWIQRWMHTGPREAEKNSEVDVICVADSSKLHKGHLPSIAAMALMAKALTCFEQCELQKKGSFTVWNTKTL